MAPCLVLLMGPSVPGLGALSRRLTSASPLTEVVQKPAAGFVNAGGRDRSQKTNARPDQEGPLVCLQARAWKSTFLNPGSGGRTPDPAKFTRPLEATSLGTRPGGDPISQMTWTQNRRAMAGAK